MLVHRAGTTTTSKRPLLTLHSHDIFPQTKEEIVAAMPSQVKIIVSVRGGQSHLQHVLTNRPSFSKGAHSVRMLSCAHTYQA